MRPLRRSSKGLALQLRKTLVFNSLGTLALEMANGLGNRCSIHLSYRGQWKCLERTSSDYCTCIRSTRWRCRGLAEIPLDSRIRGCARRVRRMAAPRPSGTKRGRTRERPAPPNTSYVENGPDQGIVIDFTTVEVSPPASVTVSVTLKVPGAVAQVFLVVGTSFVSLRPFPQFQA
jgi:hypothetical protein